MTTSARIGLIDYGSGNLRSVAKALQFVGAEVQHIVSGPIPDGLEALVLPGVGSFGDSVRQLRARRLFQPIREWLVSEKKFLGICLGYQLLFQASEESPGRKVWDCLKVKCGDSNPATSKFRKLAGTDLHGRNRHMRVFRVYRMRLSSTLF